MSRSPRTTAEAARELGIPTWKLRRMVDALGVSVPRVGQYRALSPELLERIRAQLQPKGRKE